MNPMNLFLWFALIVLSFYLMIVGKALLIPLVIAIVIWYLINALTRNYQSLALGNWKPPYSLCLAAAILTFIAVIWFMIELTSSNIAQVMKVAPNYQENLQKIIAKVLTFLRVEEAPNLTQLVSHFDFSQILSKLVGALTSIASNAGIILLYLIFLLIEQKSFDQKIAALGAADPKREASIRQLIGRINVDIQTYLWIKTLVSLLTAGVSWILMKLIGVDLAGFWALVIFLLNYIPNIGSILGTLFPSLVALVQFGTLYPFLMVAGSLGVVQFVIGNILEPRLMGRSLNLSPLVIFLSLVLWGTIWGILGMILCVPIMVIMMIVLTHFPQTRPIAILLSGDGRIKT